MIADFQRQITIHRSDSMNRRTHRRQFLQNAASIGIGLYVGGSARVGRCRSPNEKLNIGIIGVASRGAANLQHVSGENIVALCDVNEQHLAAASAQHPKAAKFVDWRKMLDSKEIDAVAVSTTDHTHATISV